MNIFNSYKRSRFFLWVNITGLSIGLAAAILLILFVVNEWSYDKHFANNERIVRLLTVYGKTGKQNYNPINLRKAYTELPNNVPGVEAAVQLYGAGKIEIVCGQKRFQNVSGLLADPEIFKVFQMQFVEGTPETALAAPNSAVLTHRYADILFGSPEAAMNREISFWGINYTVSGIVKELPKNSHFGFDILAPIKSIPLLDEAGGLEFHTYYLIRKEASLEVTRTNIEEAYRPLIAPWGELVGEKNAYGLTEKLSDVYLKSKADFSLGTTSSMNFIRILTGLALFILLLAVTNFINLFVTQGEMRMAEIGIRKANGAQIRDIVSQFFSEIAVIVGIAFVVGFFIALICIPSFGELTGKSIDLIQLLSPSFILSILVLFVVTVTLSAFYPALYLSRFSPLEILGKRIRFSRRRLTAVVVVFQSIVSIVLLSVICILYKQTAYMEKLPLGYNPENVMTITINEATSESYPAIRQELLNLPEVKAAAGSHHLFGGGCSGQTIAPWDEQDKNQGVNEYRLLAGMPELMELELKQGRFWREDDPDSVRMIILNEAAVKMLGKETLRDNLVSYKGRRAEVIGVVKDFYYDNPVLDIAPIVLSRVFFSNRINIRFHENVNPIRAKDVTTDVLRRFDPDFVLNPTWSADVYKEKFKEIKTLTRIVLTGSALSILVAMLGLLAIHLFSTLRRTKEIGIRRILGAEKTAVFLLLSFDVLKWIGFAAVIAIPVAVWFLSGQLSNYANHVALDWTVFVFPALIQCLIALAVTSGVSFSVLSQNPVKSLKTE
ncbi:MAG: ABC transporter permease [Dysgonamonadaceae bacterium]|jgi:putative ABC transport system permease protein|nr:ABC transporter permease [Dysgonamonadaceae bacterium]